MMNKDEAVQKLSKVARISVAYAEDLYDSFFPKPVVPQYVADWYEEHKDNLNESIWEYLVDWDDANWGDFNRWISQPDENGAITTLINMHQFGYEVEKEARYEVRIKGVDYKYSVLKTGDYWYFGEDWADKKIKTQSHTRKELEANGFGWVFNCEGVEVKEVDDGND